MSMIADNPTWTVAGRLKRARLLAGLEQAELASLVGVARATLSGWETGKTEPSLSNFVRLSRVTGQPLEWFAEGVSDYRSEGWGFESLRAHTALRQSIDALARLCRGIRRSREQASTDAAFWGIVADLDAEAVEA